jgi:hypothetical protein
MLIKARGLLPILCRMSASAAASGTAPKRAKMGRVIATHSGSFHCDEALACYLLKQTSKFGGPDTSIVRSRDPEILKDADVVVDVGGVYNPGVLENSHLKRLHFGIINMFLQNCTWDCRIWVCVCVCVAPLSLPGHSIG